MVKLDKHNPISWTSANGVWVAGYCFDTEGNFYEKNHLLRYSNKSQKII